jgi:chromosome segregation ATPase
VKEALEKVENGNSILRKNTQKLKSEFESSKLELAAVEHEIDSLTTQLSDTKLMQARFEESTKTDTEIRDRNLEALQERFVKMQQKAEHRRDKMQALRASLTQSEREMQSKLEENAKLRESLSRSQDAEEALEKAENEKAILRKKLQTMADDAKSANFELTTATHQIDFLRIQLSAKEQQQANLEATFQNEIEVRDADLKLAQASLAKMQQKAERRHAKIETICSGFAESERALQNQLGEHDEEKAFLRDSLSHSKDTEEALEQTQTSWRSETVKSLF